MYVILNEDCDKVFVHLSPQLNPVWEPIKDLTSKREGGLCYLTLFKDPTQMIELIQKKGIVAIQHRAIELLDEVG
jgi:hypothetical protein